MSHLSTIFRISVRCACAAGALFALLAAGCGGGQDTSGGAGTTAPTMQTSACADDPRVEVYQVGMEASSKDGALVVVFEDADPSPPAKGDNAWVIQIKDAAGKPVSGATIETEPYMPDHGHGSSVKPVAKETDQAGTYEISPINLSMVGVWEITLNITPAGGAPGSVKLTFCIDG